MAISKMIMSDSEGGDESMADDESDFELDDDEPTRKTVSKGKAHIVEKRLKKAPVSKKATKKKGDVDSNSCVLKEQSGNIPASTTAASKKTVEEIYQKKSQLEHILLRPDTYIGSVERITQPMYVLNADTKRISEKNVTYTPGLYKIYDEILVNAADNKQRDLNMDKLDICIDAKANSISVKNNGKGIPVVTHKEHGCYIPTLIFGHLLTGSNFDDEEKKTTGGRNGYGAKLANIFSDEFIVECVDSDQGIHFCQIFRNNMTVAEEPVLKKCTAAEKKLGDYTKITFSPDLKRFKMSSLDDDAVSLLSKRAYDIAGSMAARAGKRLTVSLNGEKLPVKSFQSYLELYDGINPPSAYEKIGDRWEIGVSMSVDGVFQQISFVNAICTSKGGQHTSYIADQVATKLASAVKKKNKGGVEVKSAQIKNHLCIFINCLIENPAFDSQTKENMTTRSKSFGSECVLSEKFTKLIEKSGVVETILSFAKFKQNQALKKQGGTKKTKLTGITKLDDANFAGTAKSKDCTLIITEGDSAKSLAMSGLSIVGRDYYGVFPLKGKPLNVREASHQQIVNNEEIKNVVDIMGFKFGTVYDETSLKTLRYGHLMIMADQDHDGSHIKGLVINFIHHFWPSLLNISGFLQQFITPIVKSSKGKKTLTFFTIPEYLTWKNSTGNDAKGWNVKYYKGLGTSTSAEAKEYFSNLNMHEVKFSGLQADICDTKLEQSISDIDEMLSNDHVCDAVPDMTLSGSDLITMAFSKKHVENRKVWLSNLKKDTYLNYSAAHVEGVKYSDFINKELILFSQADNQRSIPHLFDGFKPSQRKVLFACFKRKLKGEIKVAQLAGYIGEHSAYHHGEASLTGTITNMAQSFCGSNNINLLTPSGQFGTRRLGGKDSASARYIFTKLEKITRAIFHPDDDALLNYLNDDGLSIEPDFYMPVIPMVLVNGSDGIGTGWSTSVPNYNPRDIIANLRRLIKNEVVQPMVPHFCGFTGTIEPETAKREGSYIVKGIIERTADDTVHISELPIRKWTQDYKIFLESMLLGDPKRGEKGEPEIKDFKENHTDSSVSFTITASKEKLDMWEKDDKSGLLGKFKLSTTISTSNMNLFDTEGRIVKYESPEVILKIFFTKRLEFYVKRKSLLLENLRKEQKVLSNKARFVEEVCANELIVSNRKRALILRDLQDRGYDMFPKDEKKLTSEEEDSDEIFDGDSSDCTLAKGYEYLLGMKIWYLTYEKAEQLRSQLAEKTRSVAELEATAPSQIWENDLCAIEDALQERDHEMAEAATNEVKAQNKNKKHQAAKKKAVSNNAKKSKKPQEWDSDQDESENESDDLASDIVAGFSTKANAVLKEPISGVPKRKKNLVQSAEVHILKPEPGREENNDSLDESLLDRMKKKLLVSPPRKTPDVANSTSIEIPPRENEHSDTSYLEFDASKKRPSPREHETNGNRNPSIPSVDSQLASAPPAIKKSRKAEGKKPEAKKNMREKKGSKQSEPKTTTASKSRGRKKAVVDMTDDSDDDIRFDEDVVLEEPVVLLPRARSARSKKQVNYAIEIESEKGSDEDASDFE